MTTPTTPQLSVIIGLGVTGLSCARYFAEQNIPFAITDSRAEPPGLAELHAEHPEITIHCGGFSDELLAQAKELIVSPGISLNEPAIAACIARGIPAIGDIELFARRARAPIVAITGTNGKGTVTTMVGNMAQAAGKDVRVGGNIGIPTLELLQEKEPDLYVLEISSFQLETTYSLAAAAATILNLTADHLERHGTMHAYHLAKQRIYKNCRVAIYNREDDYTTPLPETIKAQAEKFNKQSKSIHANLETNIASPELVNTQQNNTRLITFGSSEPLDHEFGLREQNNQTWLAYGQELLMPVNELRVHGRHNWINALAALALGSAIHLPLPAMLKALKEFPGLPHRCQWVAEENNIIWYNDSKGTNVGATIAAIESLGPTVKGKLVLIAGGLGKNADFTLLRPAVQRYVRDVILMGKDAPLLFNILKDVTQCHLVSDMPEAVKSAHDIAQSNDAVLLSPACSSLDMFRNAEYRGEVFTQAVKERLNIR